MKKSLLSALLAILPVSWANSASLVPIGNFKYELNSKNQTAIVSKLGTSYTGHLEIPGSVVYEGVTYQVVKIQEGGFSGCTGITSFTIPSSIDEIGGYTFKGCTSLTTATLPDNKTEIPKYMFQDCTSLTSVTIPSGVTRINEYAFNNCSKLESIQLPDGLKIIEGSAFSGCTKLATITLPSGMKSIGNRAFKGCTGLTDVYSLPKTIANSSASDGFYTDQTAFDEANPSNILLHVPTTAVEAYKAKKPWSDFKDVVDNASETPSCATPAITYKDGKIEFTCETEGVEFVSTIADEDIKEGYTTQTIELKQVYKVSVYAKKEGYLPSKTVTHEIVFGNNGTAQVVGDYNQDGKVNVADIVSLADYIMSH